MITRRSENVCNNVNREFLGFFGHNKSGKSVTLFIFGSLEYIVPVLICDPLAHGLTPKLKLKQVGTSGTLPVVRHYGVNKESLISTSSYKNWKRSTQ